MVVGNHLFSFFDKKFREGVTRYELHPPSLRTVYFPTAPICHRIQLGFRKASLMIPTSQKARKCQATNSDDALTVFYLFFSPTFLLNSGNLLPLC